MSDIMTLDLVNFALEMAKPTIEAMLTGVAKRSALALVIVATGGDRVRYMTTRIFGTMPVDEWPHEFAVFAEEKVKLAVKHKMDTREVQQRPWVYREGDIKYAGAVYYPGLVVAASGVESHFDEAAARIVAALIMALCTHQANIVQADGQVDRF